MKAKYIVTLLLVGMFAVGVPVGVLADENLDGPVFSAWGEIEGPLGTGIVISQDDPSQQSQEVEEYEPYAADEFDDGGG
ncbi:MAG: hypothetical protein HKM86_04345 [Deltaproteobacteria bacterium]|nr:hypothetical protein [Deltaproteobacteria bacterium]